MAVSRDELIKQVNDLLNCTVPEDQESDAIDQLIAQTGDQQITDYIYFSQSPLTAEKIVDKALGLGDIPWKRFQPPGDNSSQLSAYEIQEFNEDAYIANGSAYMRAINQLLACDPQDYSSFIFNRSDGDWLRISSYKHNVSLHWERNTTKQMSDWNSSDITPAQLLHITHCFLASNDNALAQEVNWRTIGFAKAHILGWLMLIGLALAIGLISRLILWRF